MTTPKSRKWIRRRRSSNVQPRKLSRDGGRAITKIPVLWTRDAHAGAGLYKNRHLLCADRSVGAARMNRSAVRDGGDLPG